MKKLTSFLAAAAIIACSSCNMPESSNIPNPDTENVSVKNESEITFVVQSTDAAVTVDEYKLSKALFRVKYPNGTIITDVWTKADGDTLYFPVQGDGDYELDIYEYDEKGVLYSGSHVIKIGSDKN